MKHSRIPLGVATFVLGIVGAASTMGNNKFVANSKVFTINGTCILFTTPCRNTVGTCTTMTALHRTVYTQNTNCINVHPRF
jgi:hypothetical protein